MRFANFVIAACPLAALVHCARVRASEFNLGRGLQKKSDQAEAALKEEQEGDDERMNPPAEKEKDDPAPILIEDFPEVADQADLEQEEGDQADAESLSEANAESSSEGKAQGSRRRRRERRRSMDGWVYQYDDMRQYVDGPMYELVVLPVAADASLEEIRLRCDRMGWERKAPAYFYQQHSSDRQVCGFYGGSLENYDLPPANTGQHKRGYVATSCLSYYSEYQPAMLSAGVSREDTAGLCQCRCKTIDNCKHFTWWQDGRCYLHDGNAKMRRIRGPTAGPDACPHAASIPSALDSWLQTLSTVSFSTKFSSLTYATCPLSLAAWRRCGTSCVNQKQCDNAFTTVCMPKRDACIFELMTSSGKSTKGCDECGSVCGQVVDQYAHR